MIRSFTLLLLFVFTSIATIQSQNVGSYNFAVLEEEYQPLIDATEIQFADPWDDPDFTIPLSFDFKFFEYTNDSIYSDSNEGFLNEENTFPAESVAGFFPYLVDVTDIGFNNDMHLSPVRYQVDGPVGDQIFKFEVANAGFYEDIYYGTSTSFVNYQLWLYEKNGAIEYRYGPSLIENPMDIFFYGGPRIGAVDSLLVDVGLFQGTFYFLTGDPASPDITSFTGDLFDYYENIALDNTPVDGTVYRFTPQDVAAKDIPAKDLAISILENPVRQQVDLRITSLELINLTAEINISNSIGQSIFTININLENSLSIDVEPFPAGSYFLTIATEKGFKTMQFVKS